MKEQVVLSCQEISDIFHCLDKKYRLTAGIIHGGGLPLQEGLMLRVKDIDYERNCITSVTEYGVVISTPQRYIRLSERRYRRQG